MRRFVMVVRRLVRPIIPDPVMAWVRLRRHSSRFRVNYEVIVGDRRTARRWLAATPDTCRVVVLSPLPPATVEGLTAVLARTGADVAVAGPVRAPRLVKRLRAEPVVDVGLLVARDGTDLPESPHVAFDHARQAGLRIAILPTKVDDAVTGNRRDSLSGPTAVVLAAVPMHDVGGGGRGAQIALELLRRGFHVVFVHLFEPFETTDLGLRFVHPALEQLPLDRFSPGVLAERVGNTAGLCLIELPHPGVVEPATALRGAGFRVVYDLIDNWGDRALGGDWYSPSVERSVVGLADLLIASAPDLLAHLTGSGRPGILVPNAVNADIFEASDTAEPGDFPQGMGPVIGYHGSLYGDWFDWGALLAVAEANPTARVVVIGDDRGHPPMPDNVSFLGLKAQADLPAYVERFDVGIIPFVVNPTTHAVSPLKAFEYLASGVPVAAPPLRALEGLDHTASDPSLVEAVRASFAAERPNRSAMLAKHSWKARVGQIVDALGIEAQVSESALGRPRRVAVHHPRGDRVVAP